MITLRVLMMTVLLAGVCQSKIITRSCPVCGQCEPKRLELYGYGRPGFTFYCTKENGTGQMFCAFGQVKWVPKRVDTTGIVHWTLQGVTSAWPYAADTILGEHPDMTPPSKAPKRKCVDAVDTTGILLGQVIGVPQADTTFCDCDGDSNYWKMIVRTHRSECDYSKLYGDGVACAVIHGEVADTLYIRIPERWRKETKEVTTWIKRKKTIKEVWE